MKRQSKVANLISVLIDGVIRVGGRIHQAPTAFEAAHPMILPKSHHVSALIVRYYHHVLGHAGREHVFVHNLSVLLDLEGKVSRASNPKQLRELLRA